MVDVPGSFRRKARVAVVFEAESGPHPGPEIGFIVRTGIVVGFAGRIPVGRVFGRQGILGGDLGLVDSENLMFRVR